MIENKINNAVSHVRNKEGENHSVVDLKYKILTIYLVMEYSILFSVESGNEWAYVYKKKVLCFGKMCRATQNRVNKTNMLLFRPTLFKPWGKIC